MNIAYLTNQYPKVSHTFIRREIRALEDRGLKIFRSSIRSSGEALADPEDLEELERTFICLERPKGQILGSALAEGFRHPLKSLAALRLGFRLAKVSDRGWLRHVAYWVEAHVLLREYRRRKIDHIHVHFATNATKVARMIRLMGGPTFSFTTHGPNEFDAPQALDIGGSVAEAAFACAITSYCSAQICRWTAFEHWGRIHQIHCAVSEGFLEAYSPVPEETKTLLCIGRLSAQKGQLLLLEALAKARTNGADLDLVLVGDGEMRPQIERAITQFGLEPHVRITGWVNEQEIRTLLRDSRALVLPSFAEGLPVVIMEAFALGRPVITTYIAGIPELVENGVNGFLFPAGSVDAVSKAMEEVAALDAARLTAMGKHGHDAVAREHHQPTEAAKLHHLFQKYLVCAE